MTWEEYYEKFYDWAESTRIKKLSSVDAFGKSEEVAEVMLEFAFHHEDIVNRIARKAIDGLKRGQAALNRVQGGPEARNNQAGK